MRSYSDKYRNQFEDAMKQILSTILILGIAMGCNPAVKDHSTGSGSKKNERVEKNTSAIGELTRKIKNPTHIFIIKPSSWDTGSLGGLNLTGGAHKKDKEKKKKIAQGIIAGVVAVGVAAAIGGIVWKATQGGKPKGKELENVEGDFVQPTVGSYVVDQKLVGDNMEFVPEDFKHAVMPTTPKEGKLSPEVDKLVLQNRAALDEVMVQETALKKMIKDLPDNDEFKKVSLERLEAHKEARKDVFKKFREATAKDIDELATADLYHGYMKLKGQSKRLKRAIQNHAAAMAAEGRKVVLPDATGLSVDGLVVQGVNRLEDAFTSLTKDSFAPMFYFKAADIGSSVPDNPRFAQMKEVLQSVLNKSDGKTKGTVNIDGKNWMYNAQVKQVSGTTDQVVELWLGV